jgi:hypothetical protein
MNGRYVQGESENLIIPGSLPKWAIIPMGPGYPATL